MKVLKTIFKGSISITAVVLGIKLQHDRLSTNHILTAKETPKYTLEHVQLVFRHGARTPVCTYDLPGVEPAVWEPEKFLGDLPHTNVEYTLKLVSTGEEISLESIDPSSWSKRRLKGGMQTGKLTKNGQQMAFDVGQHLQKEYIQERKFISSIYNPNEIRVRTSSFQRTVGTVKSMLAGLYGKDQIREPIEMWTVRSQEEYLYPNFYQCPNLNRHFKVAKKDFINFRPDIREITIDINKKLGLVEKEQMIDVFHLLDLMHTREAHGFKALPDNLTQEDRKKIERAASKLFSFIIQGDNDRNILRLSVGALIEDLCQNIEEKVKNPKKVHKMEFVSAHDTTLQGLLMVTNQWKDEWPYYVSLFKIELYKDEASEHYVRLEFNGQTIFLDQSQHEEMVPIRTFLEKMEKFRVKDYKLECSKEEGK
eukprot:TCONS_00070477-protein